MGVIHEREERERGYFMGNIWYKDAFSGRIDSSILIRTAVRQSQSTWEYAAGSGITVRSHAYEELQEVLTKARIVLENPW
jgi:anthranilate/para-aminobenzoate synthase component I